MQPQNAGSATNAQAMRTVQMQVRFLFWPIFSLQDGEEIDDKTRQVRLFLLAAHDENEIGCRFHRPHRVAETDSRWNCLQEVPRLECEKSFVGDTRTGDVMKLKLWKNVLTTVGMVGIVCSFTTPAAAQTTATVAGTVKDVQGGIIPGATITLLSETRGTTITTAQTTDTGDFVIPDIPGDTYTVRVTMDGFKTLERKGVAVSPGDRVVVGTMTIEVGTLAETVLVSGEAPLIQVQTGERSFTVASVAVVELPVSGRNFALYATLAPGVVGTTSSTGTVTSARLGGGSTNYLLDGVATIDTGGNGQGIALNPDAIAEVKVLTNAYQAEYGRANGLQISGVTKSGTNRFTGSLFDIRRNADWNSNSWANVRNGVPKAALNQTDYGMTIGGPIGKPGGTNKWFFFYGQQNSPRTSGGAVNFFRVPTLLERQGDFSQSTDNNGNLFNLIRNASTGLPCTATNTSGCYQDGGVLGRIPQSALYQLGLNVLNTYPSPNVQGLNYNLVTVAPYATSSTRQPTFRTDYVASSRLRLTAKYAGQLGTSNVVPGTIPGFNDTLLKFPAVLVPSATVDFVLNPTTVFESTWGMNQINQQGAVPIDPVTNRCNVGLCNFPLIFPNAGAVPSGSYQAHVLGATNTPFYSNNQILMAPTYAWGSRVGNPPPNNTYPVFLDYVRTTDVAISITKLIGRHTAKAGFQSDHSLKVQNLGIAGATPFQGTLSFANDSNNPLDTGFGYANAALGIFDSFTQENQLFEGHYIYNSFEGFLQDNWKMTSKLTLDYGVRLTNQEPQYDTKEQSSNFFPNLWSASSAPQLYVAGCAVAISPCPSTSRVAVNPVTQVSLGANSAAAVGTLVPNTGVLTNGIIQAGHGIAKGNYVWPTLVPAPRVGAAYDVTGSQRIVVRGSIGLFFDRPVGQTVFSQIGNPPNGQASTIQYAQLQSLGSSGLQTTAPPGLAIYYYNSQLPSTLQWNVGVQMALPWSSSLDVSYVATHGYNLIAFGSVGTAVVPNELDLNAPDLGAAYLPQNQDPTLAASAIPGATSVTTNQLRPYPGIGAVLTTWGRFWTQFDSIQTSYNRRFSHGWQASLNYTLSLRSIGNTGSQLHLQHNPDGTITDAPSQAATDALIANTGNRRHIIKGNVVWNLPKVSGSNMAARTIGVVADGWQLSGVFTGGSTAPYDATFTYATNGAQVNLTGSPNYPARIKVNGNPSSGCLSNQYQQFNTSMFSGPTYGSIGNESGANLLSGCVDHTIDLALARTIGLVGHSTLQLRLDLFNAFNAVVINTRNSIMQLTSPSASTIVTDNQFNPDGTLNAARLTPLNGGFGAATAAQSMRTAQIQLRFQF